MVSSRTRSGGPEAPGATVVIDDTDKAIIEALQADGRMPYTRLGTTVGLSEAAVRQRVQRLTESGVVQIVAVTDPLMLGFHRMAMVGLHVEGDLRAVAAHPEIAGAIVGRALYEGAFTIEEAIAAERPPE